MQILTILKDSKHSNANSNLSKGIRSIRMQIPNQIWSIKMQILTLGTKFEAFEAFESKFEPFERDFTLES